MKKSRLRKLCKLFSISLIITSVIASISYVSRVIITPDHRSEDAEKPYVALIAKSNKTDFWLNVFKGVEAASAEYNLRVSFDAPENEEDYNTQNTFIMKAIENKAAVIILSAIDFDKNAEAIEKANKSGIKIITIDSDVNSDKVQAKISTNNYEAGVRIGQTILNTEEMQLHIGIVNFDKNSANGQQREQGIRDIINNDARVMKIQTINVASTVEDAKTKTIELLAQNPELNVIVSLNEPATLGVGYAIKELELTESTTVLGFDNHVQSIAFLESGEIDDLIVQNPYAMGYLGIEYAYHLIYNITIDNKNVNTDISIINKDNMFTEQYRNILFPVIESRSH